MYEQTYQNISTSKQAVNQCITQTSNRLIRSCYRASQQITL